MRTYHVEFITPDGCEIIREGIPARSGQAAIEKAIRAAGFTGFRFCWYQGAWCTAPEGKRPSVPVYTNDEGEFIHTIAWTE